MKTFQKILSLPRKSVLWLALIASLAFGQWTMAEDAVIANYDSNLERITIDIGDDGEGMLTFGRYAETTIHLFGANSGDTIRVNYDARQLPPGMELQQTGPDQYLLYGDPRFTGEWCLNFFAQTSSGLFGEKEICVYAQDNEELDYPRFDPGLERSLPMAAQGSYYSYNASLLMVSEASRSYELSAVAFTSLPSGLSVQVNKYNYSLNIAGTPGQTGVLVFAAKLVDLSTGVENSRQFHLVVGDQYEQPFCPRGYYFDQVEGRCISSGSECAPGSFYDEERGGCVSSVVRTNYCPSRYYYDHFLDRCVRTDYQRCPYNYRYDPYYSRCVPSYGYCPIGTKYSWIQRSCIPVWNSSYYRTCGYGSYYDSYYGRCVSYQNRCGAGSYWDRNHGCISFGSCRVGYDWDSRYGRCVPRGGAYGHGSWCRAGYRYDSGLNRCVPRWDVRPTPPRPRPPVIHPPRPIPPRPTPPIVRPEPRPNPRPVPPIVRPEPRPNPRPVPPIVRPEPRPNPRPVPPIVRPEPRPNPRPVPPIVRPEPRPNPRPVPPIVRPEPRPNPRPVPPIVRPEPRPNPRPVPPIVRPNPRPNPGNPGHGGGGGGRPTPPRPPRPGRG